LLALASPEIEVLAIIVSYGEFAANFRSYNMNLLGARQYRCGSLLVSPSRVVAFHVPIAQKLLPQEKYIQTLQSSRPSS
jgi:hypothetical protein